MKQFLKGAASVVPSPRQLAWFEMEKYAFIHFGMNTYTNQEWGDGKADAKLFNPRKLDCDQWVSAIQSAGLKGMILTCKHHDGFCLWPSRYTDYSVQNSSYPVNIVKQASDACRRAGLKFGIYLSLWDRHNPDYGTAAYNDYFCHQLEELLTEYGDIFYVWFDNACGEGKNGKKQVYDFERYFALIRHYQPQAVIFHDAGPDVRWCGNEAGRARHAEWSVVPKELCRFAEVQTGPGPLCTDGSLEGIYNTHQEIGSLANIMYSQGLAFVPAEIDLSIRPGWFYHPNEHPHSLERLLQAYLASCGSNACLNLNIPPNPDGLIEKEDVERLAAFGKLIDETFGHPLPCQIQRIGGSASQPLFKMTFADPVQVKAVILKEDLRHGQRVESFQIYDSTIGRMNPLYEGTCIGHQKICLLSDPFAIQNPLIGQTKEKVSCLYIQITAARDEVFLRTLKAV